MKVFIKGHNFEYEIINVIRLFFEEAKVFELSEKFKQPKQNYIYTLKIEKKNKIFLFCEVCSKGLVVIGSRELEPTMPEKAVEKQFAKLIYSMLCDITGTVPPYGILTGIRPAKLAISSLEQGLSGEQAFSKLKSDYLVSDKKAKLIVDVAKFSAQVRALDEPLSYSLYVSIPFCKTRCSYCSFVSKAIAKQHHLIEPYLSCLIKELEATKEIALSQNLKLKTVYVGGGTPSVLEHHQIEILCEAIDRIFNPKQCLEYTFEAGRADTITKQKLEVLKDFGVTRLSINPQTKNDYVLKQVGRTHSYKQVEQSFDVARKLGFDNINADLIAGLPHDSIESFKESVDWLIKLEAENITVHTLTTKRASTLKESPYQVAGGVSSMTEYALQTLTEKGYFPYYMYRQKSTAENLENIGYCKKGKQGLYNIFIMDETHSIFSCGAGGVTKFVEPFGNRIERVFNYKYPHEYIEGFEEIIKRKRKVFEFYDNKF